MTTAKNLFREWNQILDKHQAPGGTDVQTYAQVINVVNQSAKDNDTLVTAAGGIPGEVTKGWRVKNPGTFDLEFGFSCMGYEIPAGWGHAMAKQGDGTPIVMVGDGTYLMMNSDIYSTVLTGHKIIVVICDNGGFSVINRLQNFKGIPSFNNQLIDCRIQNPDDPPHVDWAKHAESMGALSRHCNDLEELAAAMEWAQTTDRTTVISIVTHPSAWVPGDADWDVGVPEVSDRESVREARAHHLKIRAKQRIGV